MLFFPSATSDFSPHTCSCIIFFCLFISGSVSLNLTKVSTESWPAVRPDHEEVRRPLSSPGSGSATWRGLTRSQTHTHIHLTSVFIHVHKRTCTHTHTHAHNLPHPHIDIRIQKHTCQGLSTVWAKAKKSGPPSVSLYVVSHVCYIKANPFSSHFLIWNNGMSNFHI